MIASTRLLAVAAMVALTALAGCAHRGQSAPAAAAAPARPAWIDNPGDGVSASAGFHVRGKQAQEELAVTRAREEFAKRYGVTISSEHDTVQTTVNDRASSVSEKSIREEVREREVKAQVREKWLDPDTGALWVWLVPAP